jgi:hypothetical protein
MCDLGMNQGTHTMLTSRSLKPGGLFQREMRKYANNQTHVPKVNCWY